MAKEELDFLSKYIYNRKPIHTCSGSPIKKVYQRYVTDNGFYSVHQVGEHNCYEEIQKNNTNLSVSELIKRYQAGDLSAIPQTPATIIDITDFPDNIHDMHKKIEEVRSVFDRLPVETRSQYNYSFDNFLANPTLAFVKQQQVSKKEEVKKEENVNE